MATVHNHILGNSLATLMSIVVAHVIIHMHEV